MQEVFEGCLTKLEGCGLVQVILDSTADLMDAGFIYELDCRDFVHLVRTCPS